MSAAASPGSGLHPLLSGSTQGDPLINLRSKEQEAELVRQTLAALTAMRIRFPGKSEEEAESVLDEVSAGFSGHKRATESKCGSDPLYSQSPPGGQVRSLEQSQTIAGRVGSAAVVFETTPPTTCLQAPPLCRRAQLLLHIKQCPVDPSCSSLLSLPPAPHRCARARLPALCRGWR